MRYLSSEAVGGISRRRSQKSVACIPDGYSDKTCGDETQPSRNVGIRSSHQSPLAKSEGGR